MTFGLIVNPQSLKSFTRIGLSVFITLLTLVQCNQVSGLTKSATHSIKMADSEIVKAFLDYEPDMAFIKTLLDIPINPVPTEEVPNYVETMKSQQYRERSEEEPYELEHSFSSKNARRSPTHEEHMLYLKYLYNWVGRPIPPGGIQLDLETPPVPDKPTGRKKFQSFSQSCRKKPKKRNRRL